MRCDSPEYSKTFECSLDGITVDMAANQINVAVMIGKGHKETPAKAPASKSVLEAAYCMRGSSVDYIEVMTVTFAKLAAPAVPCCEVTFQSWLPIRDLIEYFREAIIQDARTSSCDPRSAVSRDATSAVGSIDSLVYVRAANYTVGS